MFFPAMRALSMQSADAFILVYDITDSSTFDEARVIRDQIHETKATTAVPIVVVGNKIDLLEDEPDKRELLWNQKERKKCKNYENNVEERI
ncbi:Ras-related protein Rap1 [Pseudolycoriella hygida]|uniref:Ras-related protein Rap1 n=1 Tax=Pseudolycoriella hygida TaxID=35572 RepID=A0A9Q0NE52_9DIPT|nr:Ras-related protein Rap1 [Pseudolycoriella hygida]